jgi:DNA-cytosine methyltransferase
LNVLSLFDGISCGQVALERTGIKVDNYFASEINPQAIKVTQNNYPNTKQIGDVTEISDHFLDSLPEIDLYIGGSPCQDLSVYKLGTDGAKGLEGDKSKLFYEYLRILKEVEPRYFFLENVKMKQDSEWQLNKHLNTQGIHVNSSLVSYQNRPRIYWTSLEGVTLPKDRHINFQDFKDTDYDYCKQFKVNRTPSREKMWNGGNGRNSPFTRMCKCHTCRKGVLCNKKTRSST